MAHTEADHDAPTPEYDAATLPLEAGSGDPDDYDSRDEKARREKMVVIPLWDDQWGEFRGAAKLLSQSGSTYELNVTESDCSCPDNAINQPPDGCKHERRLIALIEDGTLPAPPRGRGTPETLDDYYREYALGQLEQFAAIYRAFGADADRADDTDAFEEAREEIARFFEALAEAYDEYDATVTDLPDRPTLDDD